MSNLRSQAVVRIVGAGEGGRIEMNRSPIKPGRPLPSALVESRV